MQQNWFTTALVAVLAGALGAVGFGVAGAQSDDDGLPEGVTIKLDQPAAAADGSADSVSLVCPDGVGATGQGGGGAPQGGGGPVPANTNTVVNGIEIQNENEQEQFQEQFQEQLQVEEDIVVTEPEVDAAPADTSEQAVTPDTTAAP